MPAEEKSKKHTRKPKVERTETDSRPEWSAYEEIILAFAEVRSLSFLFFTMSYEQVILSALFHQQIHHAYLKEACATPSALASLVPCTLNTLSITSLAMVAVALSKTHTEDGLVAMRTYLRKTISDQRLALIPLHGVTLGPAEVRDAGGAAARWR
jgi:hypothetical protein